MALSMHELRARKEEAKWRDPLNHTSSRTCDHCVRFNSRQRLCEYWKFLTLPGASCTTRFMKPKSAMRKKTDADKK